MLHPGRASLLSQAFLPASPRFCPLGRETAFPSQVCGPGQTLVGGGGVTSQALSQFQGKSQRLGLQPAFAPLPRTASWSARISTTMTATSPTAPSAAGAARCSCAGTTIAAGEGPPSSPVALLSLPAPSLPDWPGAESPSVPLGSFADAFLPPFFFGHPKAHGVPGPGIRVEPQLPPRPQLQQGLIFNLPGGAGLGRPWDEICLLALRRCRRCHCATVRTPAFQVLLRGVRGSLGGAGGRAGSH